MEETEVNARWQAEMGEFFQDLEGRRPDEGSWCSTRSSTSTERTADRRARARPRARDRRASAPSTRSRTAPSSSFAGEVHGLVGENGAGKSTLVKILAGVHRPDSGRLLIDGVEAIFDNARQAQQAGIAIIFQEPTLFPDLSVAENIFIGSQPLKAGHRIDGRRMRRETAALFDRLGVRIDPDRLGTRPVDRRPAARRDREGAHRRRARDRDGRADGSADHLRGRAALRDRAHAARRGRGRAVRVAPPRGDLRALSARHRDARRPARSDEAHRGAHDRVDHPRDGRARHGRALPEGACGARQARAARSSA